MSSQKNPPDRFLCFHTRAVVIALAVYVPNSVSIKQGKGFTCFAGMGSIRNLLIFLSGFT